MTVVLKNSARNHSRKRRNLEHNREKVVRAEQMEREAMERNERDEQEQTRKKLMKQEQGL